MKTANSLEIVGEIRPLEEADFTAAVALAAPLKSAAFNWEENSLRVQFRQLQSFGFFAPGEQLRAFVCLRKMGEVSELPVLATHRDFQGQKIMKTLLSYVFATHCKGQEIWLEVHEANLNARNLYKKMGFQECGRRAKYYRDGAAAILCTRSSD